MRTKPDFRKTTPQILYDGWRQKERILLYSGQCIVCGSRVYDFADGENDPRGVLGEKHSNSGITVKDVEGTEHEFPVCFQCDNEESTYQKALDKALRQLARIDRAHSKISLCQYEDSKQFWRDQLAQVLLQTVAYIHTRQTSKG